MAKRILAQGNPKRSRIGECSLCGQVTKLSKTHVPPKAAGNRGAARVAVEVIEDGRSSIGLGTPRDGGMWGWWFCQYCNSRTRIWDEEFMRWSIPLVLEMNRGRPRVGSTVFFAADAADPGALVRELWAWSFAIDPHLRAEHPDVAEAVRLGTAVAPPEEHRMLLAATSDLRIWVAGQRGGAVVRTSTQTQGWHVGVSGLVLPGPELLPIPRVAVAGPPFVALLAEGRDASRLPYFDTGNWLAEIPGTTRVVHAPLVITRAFGEAGALTLISYEELAS